MFPVRKLPLDPDLGVELVLGAGKGRRVPLAYDRNHLRVLNMELKISRIKTEEGDLFGTEVQGSTAGGVLAKIDVGCQQIAMTKIVTQLCVTIAELG